MATPKESEFAALITGAVAGALMAKADPVGPFLIDVNVPRDEAGNYKHEVEVTGSESGTKLRISVEVVDEWVMPEEPAPAAPPPDLSDSLE